MRLQVLQIVIILWTMWTRKFSQIHMNPINVQDRIFASLSDFITEFTLES